MQLDYQLENGPSTRLRQSALLSSLPFLAALDTGPAKPWSTLVLQGLEASVSKRAKPSLRSTRRLCATPPPRPAAGSGLSNRVTAHFTIRQQHFPNVSRTAQTESMRVSDPVDYRATLSLSLFLSLPLSSPPPLSNPPSPTHTLAAGAKGADRASAPQPPRPRRGRPSRLLPLPTHGPASGSRSAPELRPTPERESRAERQP